MQWETVKTTLIVLIVVVSIIVLAEDLREEYTWIYPLDTTRQLPLQYSKSSTAIAIVDLESEKRTLIVNNGVLIGTATISECSTCYTIILASSLNLYVLVFSLVTTTLTLLVLYTETTSKLVITAVITLFLTVNSTLYLYIKAGENLGYSVEEHKTPPIKLENMSISIIPIGNTTIITYSYRLRDNITKLSLISIKVRNYNPEVSLILLNISGSLIRLNENTALYLNSGELEVLILSQQSSLNSTLEYYKLTFTPVETRVHTYLTVLLLFTALHATISTITLHRRITTKKSKQQSSTSRA